MKRNTRLIRLFNEQAGNCAWCLEPMTEELGHANTAEIDHVTAITRGGLPVMDNEVAACSECNRDKGDQSVVSWRKKKAAAKMHECLFVCY
jgi:CRISPR/Cas system Type II protein with McrA/HNH and RuvC-like nuclease domain